jgi:predicted GIY-YIG superfamily endonuclease
MIYIIYKISIADQCYIGSTKDFKQRKAHHKSTCNSKTSIHNNLKLYKIVRENGGWNYCEMKPIEEFECETKRQAECREEHWIREYNATLNMKQAFLTEEELQTKQQQWKQKSYDSQKITPSTSCECGGHYKKSNYSLHLNTKKHQKFLNKNVAVINNE